MTLVSDILEYTVISAPAGKLILGNHSTRLQLNSIIIAPFGSGKSTLLFEIESRGLGEVLTDYTLPGLVGTIKGGKLVKGFIVKSAGKCLMIDEFQKFKRKERDAILSLMENHRFSRSLAGDVNPMVYHDSKYCKVFTYENFLHVYARASYLIATMYFRNKREEDHALLSRAFPIPVTEERGMANSILKGKQIFSISGSLDKSRAMLDDASVKVPDNILEKAMTHSEFYRQHKVREGYIIRGLIDILRIAGINSILNGSDIVTQDSLDFAAKYIPLQVMGYKQASLTPSQIKILDYVYSDPGKTAKEIAKAIDLDEGTVENYLKILERFVLVKRYSVGGKFLIYPVKMEEV